jgi:hypothetical protein
MAMTDLLLRPRGSEGGNEFEIIDGDWIVGHIVSLNARAGTSWMWSLDHAFHKDRDPTHGFAATREDAMQAFARAWESGKPTGAAAMSD